MALNLPTSHQSLSAVKNKEKKANFAFFIAKMEHK